MGVAACALAPMPAAAKSPVPAFPAGTGTTMLIDVHTGELLSIASDRPLSAAAIRQFEALPGSKTYTVDVATGQFVSITRN
jgi:hypothetical protein